MSADKQVKINEELHKKVKKFVDNESTYSSYKSFYEEAVRKHLKKNKDKIDPENLSEKEIRAIRKIIDKELEQ